MQEMRTGANCLKKAVGGGSCAKKYQEMLRSSTNEDFRFFRQEDVEESKSLTTSLENSAIGSKPETGELTAPL